VEECRRGMLTLVWEITTANVVAGTENECNALVVNLWLVCRQCSLSMWIAALSRRALALRSRMLRSRALRSRAALSRVVLSALSRAALSRCVISRCALAHCALARCALARCALAWSRALRSHLLTWAALLVAHARCALAHCTNCCRSLTDSRFQSVSVESSHGHISTFRAWSVAFEDNI